MSINPENYPLLDFLKWNRDKSLVLSPEFQRGSVWSTAAKTYLIDSILRDFPIPQIYFRTRVDPETQSIVREVVDGQQRLRAIIEFAANRLKLSQKSEKFRGMTYADLDSEQKEKFLSYKVSTIQLLNANDADILEMFARLNSSGVKVTPAELRHATHTEPVKWAVYEATVDHRELWDRYKVIGVRDSVRMRNHSFMAELFITVDEGLSDGGEANISKYYRTKKSKEAEYFEPLREKIDDNLEVLLRNFGDTLQNSIFFAAPNFLILFAALAYLRGKSPGLAKWGEGRNYVRLERLYDVGVSWRKADRILHSINDEVSEDIDDGKFEKYVAASKSSTQRIASRRIRFETLVTLMADA